MISTVFEVLTYIIFAKIEGNCKGYTKECLEIPAFTLYTINHDYIRYNIRSTWFWILEYQFVFIGLHKNSLTLVLCMTMVIALAVYKSLDL